MSNLQYKNFNFKLIGFLIVLTCFCSCKKSVIPPAPGSISGPANLCPGESNIVYSIEPVNGSNYYLWTVPDGAKIISGQGTTSIKVTFGKKLGKICVRSNNKSSESPTTCLDVELGGISNQWCQGVNFAGGFRQQGVAFSLNNKGYFGTGIDAATSIKYNDFWEYDPIENTWSQKANFGGTPRVDAVAFTINNKGYVGSGFGNGTGIGYLPDFWEYDANTNSWTKKADYNMAITYCFAFAIGSKGYVGGGTYITNPINSTYDFYEFDPSSGTLGKWTKKANLLVARSSASGFSIGNKGYYGLGSDQSVYEDRLMEYDPNDLINGTDANGNPMGKWIFKTNFPGKKRNNSAAFSIGNKGYIGCGYDGENYYNDFWEYDPISDIWTKKTDLPVIEGRKSASGFSIGTNGYLTMGAHLTNSSLNDIWIYAQ